MCNTAGIAYVTGAADLAGERRQKLGMGAVSCRQGHHAQMAASHKVGCGASGSFFRGGERHGLEAWQLIGGVHCGGRAGRL